MIRVFYRALLVSFCMSAGSWASEAAAGVSISASPNPCVVPAGQQFCTTQVSWSGGPVNTQIWVTDLGINQPSQFGSGGSATLAAPWIQAGRSYLFQMRNGGETGQILASTTVTGQSGSTNLPPLISLTVSPNSGLIAPATVLMSATASDPEGSLSRVEFYRGTVYLGARTAPPYELQVTGLAAGSHSLTARAFDTPGLQTTSTPTFVNVSPPSTATIFANPNPCLAAAGQQVCTTQVSWSGGPSNTEVWVTDTGLGTSMRFGAGPSYSVVAPWIQVGRTYRFDMHAGGQAGTLLGSATVTGQSASANQPPLVTLTVSPNSGLVAPATVVMRADASDPEGNLSRVEFYNGSTSVGTRTEPPYEITLTGLAAGSYSLSARAFDNQNLATTSGTVAINVAATPSAMISASPNPCVAEAGQQSCLTTVRWSGGPSNTEVWVTDMGLGTSMRFGASPSSSIAAPWIQVGRTYRFDLHAGGQTAPVLASTSVTGQSGAPNQPPILILRVTPETDLIAPASVQMRATASDPDGSISRVEFYDGANYLSQLSAPPFHLTWSGLTAGSHSLTARAFDNQGQQTTSAAVVISVGTSGSASLSASPNPCIAAPGQQACTTQVNWSGGPSNAQVWVTIIETGQSFLFGSPGSGQVSAPWIQLGKTYRFDLRAEGRKGQILASSTVTGQSSYNLPSSYENFAPFQQSVTGFWGTANGQNYNWNTRVEGNQVKVRWDALEVQALRPNCRFTWVYGYGERSNGTAPAYAVDTSRALLTIDGVTTDITGECGVAGQPYALRTIDGRPYRIQVWGNIYGNPDNPAVPPRSYYWDASWSYEPASRNPCWAGPGSTERPALVQQEAWWERANGTTGPGEWKRLATGHVDSAGTPTGANVEYGTELEIAYQAGYAWNMRSLKVDPSLNPPAIAEPFCLKDVGAITP